MARTRKAQPKRPEPITTAELVEQRLLIPLQEAARLLSIHRTTIFRMERAGEIRVVRIGRRAFLTAAELQRFVGNLEAAS